MSNHSYFQPRGHFGRGRGSGQRGRGGFNGRDAETSTRELMEGLLLGAVQILDRPQLSEDETDVVISEVQSLASYNYTNVDSPTMIVPGCPPVWVAPSLPITVQPVIGTMYNDFATVKFSDYPMLPLFEAVDFMQSTGSRSDSPWSAVDIITDRNNLMKLAGWADDSCLGPHSKLDFRIDLQLVGQRTVLFQRWEEQVERWGGGYSETFEQASCRPAMDFGISVKPGANHIISYDWSGVKLIVQFDSDAYHEEVDNAMDTSSDDISVDTLSTDIGSMKISSAAPVTNSEHSANLTLLRGGKLVPQSSLIKIKTRSVTNLTGFPSVAEYLQLFFGQTPTLYVGVHERGTFAFVQPFTLRAMETHFSVLVKPGLQRLQKTLKVIGDIVAEQGREMPLSLVCEDGILYLMERQSKRPLLPRGILARFH